MIALCSSEIFPPNYEIFCKYRNILGGGVFIAVRNSIVGIVASPQPNFSSDAEMIWIKLQFTNSKALCRVAFYRPGEEETC